MSYKFFVAASVMVSGLLGTAAILVAWDHPGTAAVWLAVAWLVWPAKMEVHYKEKDDGKDA